MKKERGIIGLIAALVIALAVLGAGSYFAYKYSNLQQQNQQLVGNDKDEHGCIGSAGYSWCEAKQKCLRIWEEPCEEQKLLLNDVYPLFSDLKWSQAGPSPRQSMPGNETTATGEINANQDAQEFFKYYDKKLKALGWEVDNNFAADGIKGSQTGYKKGNNYVVLSYNITPGKITSGQNEPLQWECPCTVDYILFTGSLNQ